MDAQCHGWKGKVIFFIGPYYSPHLTENPESGIGPGSQSTLNGTLTLSVAASPHMSEEKRNKKLII